MTEGLVAWQGFMERYSRQIVLWGRDVDDQVRLGRGSVAIVCVGLSAVIVKVYGNFECELFGNTGKPEGHLVRGMIAGFVAAIWNVEMNDVEAGETRCLAKGDPYCEFEIKKRRRKLF